MQDADTVLAVVQTPSSQPAASAPATVAVRPESAQQGYFIDEEKSNSRALEPEWLWRGNIPSLNGLRAVSILIVIASHLATRRGTPVSWLPSAGEIGVEMFFVISGFLITLLLFREQQRTGHISWRGFYLRRVCRIVPAYVFYLFGLFLLQCFGVLHLSMGTWLRSFTYTTSLFPLPDWDCAHFWSLAVEEHFYLAWPLVLLLFGTRRAGYAAAACLALTPLLRMLLALFLGSSAPSFGSFTPTRLDAIAAGCCLAFLAVAPTFRAATRFANGWRSTFGLLGGCTLLVVVQMVMRHPERIGLEQSAAGLFLDRFLYDTFKPVLMAALVWLCVNNSTQWFGRILNARPIAFVGVLSYSLYLWQQFFLNANRQHWTCLWPVNLICILSAALVSYAFIERPFLRLKDRLKT
jgi:peptidoglycan/LPS O-acetylase OafA/YrhL